MPSRRTRRTRRAPIVITAALAVLLTGVTAVLLLHGQIPNGRRRTVTTTPATPRPRRDPASTPPRAQLAGSPTAPAIDPAGLRWADFHGIALPVSAQDGPREMRGGLASGFTDTPSGALLAAINIGVRTAALWGPAIYAATISRQVTGPDQATLLHNQAAAYARLRASAHVRQGQPTGRGYAVEAAYRFVAYTPADATADVVTAGPGSDGTTVLAATRIEVVWRGGDWRLVAPPGGDWGNSATAVSSRTGYTTFPGQG